MTDTNNAPPAQDQQNLPPNTPDQGNTQDLNKADKSKKAQASNEPPPNIPPPNETPNGDQNADASKDEPPAEIDYSFPIDEAFKEKIAADDKVIELISTTAKELGVTADEFNAVKKVIGGLLPKLEEAGLFQEPFNLENELSGLENGKERYGKQEAFITALKTNGNINEGEAAELLGLAMSKDGLAVLEKIRGLGKIEDIISPEKLNTEKTKSERFKELVNDPRFGKDAKYTRDAEGEIARDGLSLRG